MESLFDQTPLQTIDQGNPTTLTFFMASSTDHKTPVTGATLTVKISKNGAAPVTPAGTVSEIGLGWYKLAATAADVSVAGTLILSVSAASSDPVEQPYTVLPNPSVNATGFAPPSTTGVYLYTYQATNLPSHGNTLGVGANR